MKSISQLKKIQDSSQHGFSFTLHRLKDWNTDGAESNQKYMELANAKIDIRHQNLFRICHFLLKFC